MLTIALKRQRNFSLQRNFLHKKPAALFVLSSNDNRLANYQKTSTFSVKQWLLIRNKLPTLVI